MDNKSNGTSYRNWKIALDIERFIDAHGEGYFDTRHNFYRNYFHQILTLLDKKQIIIHEDEQGMTSVCGWARVKPEEEWRINKVKWTLPEDVDKGDNLYISFCVIRNGNINKIRAEIVRRYRNEVNEVFWFNAPSHKFIRIKNILKEKKNGSS